MMNKKNLILFFILVIIFGCSENNEYDIESSGVSAVDGSINWIDGGRIIFSSFSGGGGAVKVWDLKEEKVSTYSRPASGGICYADGYIEYGEKKSHNKTYVKKGMLGEEVSFIYDWNDAYHKKLLTNRFTCKRFLLPRTHEGKKINYLKNGHGYLELGDMLSGKYEYPVLVRFDGKRIKMPFNRIHYRPPNGFYNFKKAYFIWAVTPPNQYWKTKGYKEAWWLYPDGRTEEIRIPLIPDITRGSILLYPVKDGYILISHGRKSKKNSGGSGIYLLGENGGLQRKILSGMVSRSAISEDGCKIAFSHNDEVSNSNTLKMINLCGTNKE